MSGFLYNEVATKIEREIRALEAGAKLPSEREMAAKYGVSRNVLREALRLLSEKGVLVSMPGRGAYVANNSRKKLTARLEDILESSNSDLNDIVEVRKTLEFACVQKAVEKATAQDIEELEALYNAMDMARGNIKDFNRLDRKFHVRLAKCSQNAMYQMLVDAFFHLTDEKLFLLTQLFPSRIDSAQREHKELIMSLKDRNLERALLAAGKHFNISDILSGEIVEKEKARSANDEERMMSAVAAQNKEM